VCWSVPSARAAGSLAVRSRRPPLDPLDACARSRGGFLGARPRSVDPLGACAQPPPLPTPLYTSCPPPPSSPHGMEARLLAAHVVRFPGRPAAAAAEAADAFLDFLPREYLLAACHPLASERTRVGMMDHLMAMDVVITMIFDPDELGRELAPFYDGVFDATGIRSAVSSWVLHEQIESGHRVGWVPRAVGLM